MPQIRFFLRLLLSCCALFASQVHAEKIVVLAAITFQDGSGGNKRFATINEAWTSASARISADGESTLINRNDCTGTPWGEGPIYINNEPVYVCGQILFRETPIYSFDLTTPHVSMTLIDHRNDIG